MAWLTVRGVAACAGPVRAGSTSTDSDIDRERTREVTRAAANDLPFPRRRVMDGEPAATRPGAEERRTHGRPVCPTGHSAPLLKRVWCDQWCRWDTRHAHRGPSTPLYTSSYPVLRKRHGMSRESLG